MFDSLNELYFAEVQSGGGMLLASMKEWADCSRTVRGESNVDYSDPRFYCNTLQLWKNVRGAQDKINALTCASSASMKCERQGVEVLVAVYSCLQEVSENK